MAINPLSIEQANPGLWGAQRVGDIYKRILENQAQGIKNRYMPEGLLSKIRSQNASAGVNEAEIPWIGKKAQSLIEYQKQLGRHAGALAEGVGLENNIGRERVNTLQQILELQKEEAERKTQQIPQNDQSYGISNFNPQQSLDNIIQNIGQQQQMPYMRAQEQLQKDISNNTMPLNQITNSQQHQITNSQHQITNSQQPQIPQHPQLTSYQPPSNEQKISTLQDRLNMLNAYGRKVGVASKQTPEEKISTAKTIAQNNADIKINTKDIEKSKDTSSAAHRAMNSLEKLSEVNGKLKNLEAGPWIGNFKAMSSAKQEFKAGANELVQATIDSMKGAGRVTDALRRFTEQMKPNLEMNEEARNRSIAYYKAVNMRNGEEIGFMNAAIDAGFRPQDRDAVWELYNKERPEFDAKTGYPIEENLSSYSDYLNEDALKAAKSGKPYSPRSGKPYSPRNGVIENAITNKMVTIMLPNGHKANIPEENIEKALSRGAKRV